MVNEAPKGMMYSRVEFVLKTSHLRLLPSLLDQRHQVLIVNADDEEAEGVDRRVRLVTAWSNDPRSPSEAEDRPLRAVSRHRKESSACVHGR
jgi:hypothetical protein